MSDKTIQAEGLTSFLKIFLGGVPGKSGRQLASNVLKNPGWALEITSNIATAAATKSPKAALSSLPEVINFHHTGKSLYLGKFVYYMPYKCHIEQIDYTHLHHWKKLV